MNDMDKEIKEHEEEFVARLVPVYEVLGKKYYIIQLIDRNGKIVAEISGLSREQIHIYDPEQYSVTTYGEAFRIEHVSAIAVEDLIKKALESVGKEEEGTIKVLRKKEETPQKVPQEIKEKKKPFLSLFKKLFTKKEKKVQPTQTEKKEKKIKFRIPVPKLKFKIPKISLKKKKEEERNKEEEVSL